MFKQFRELITTNLLNICAFLFIGIAQIKDVIEIILFITLILFNIGKIKQLIISLKEEKKDGTKTQN